MLCRSRRWPAFGDPRSAELHTTKFTARPTRADTELLSRASRSQSTVPTRSTSMSLSTASRPDANDPKMSAIRTPGIWSSPRPRIRATSPSRRMRSLMLATRSLDGSSDHTRRLPVRRLVTAPACSRWSSAAWVECGSAAMRRAISRVCSSCPGMLTRRSSARRAAGLRPRSSAMAAMRPCYNSRCSNYNSCCNALPTPLGAPPSRAAKHVGRTKGEQHGYE